MKFQNTAFLAFSLLLASLMLSCSSMEADTVEEAYGNRLPPDFDNDEFGMLNPDIRLAQSIDTISALNAKLKQRKSDEGEDTTALIKEYEGLFYGDLGSLTSPAAVIAREYLQWTDETIASSLTTTQNKARLNKYNLYERLKEDDAANALKNFIDSLEFNKDVYAMTYARGGKKSGRPYRQCRAEDAKTTLRKDMIGIENYDYSNYAFCATEPKPPYDVYLIQ